MISSQLTISWNIELEYTWTPSNHCQKILCALFFLHVCLYQVACVPVYLSVPFKIIIYVYENYVFPLVSSTVTYYFARNVLLSPASHLCHSGIPTLHQSQINMYECGFGFMKIKFYFNKLAGTQTKWQTLMKQKRTLSRHSYSKHKTYR